ncbi:MAG: LysM peptidoglycan-binding domain-containing protein [Bacteroidota bacterium]|nr:LysM peptidoglycan-binding domain-containing protein [Bacteroidota bacterium]
MKRLLIILFFSFGCFLKSSAQDMTAQEYVQKYKDLAIEEMKRMGVPAAITLAQGLLETQNGNSELFKESNNHFGIKCKSTWTAETVRHDDDAPGECFRKYKSAEDSYRDHSNFLRGNDRYAFLFKLDPSDYKAWAYGLRKAGYATNPKYPQILIKNIEDNNLEQYTDEALNDVPHFDASQYTDDTKSAPTETADNNDNDSDLTQPMNLTINGSKALFVPKGTSLLAVATEHNINLEKLLTINDLSNDGLLQKGQYIFLEKKQKEGQKDFCIAQQNETLYDISQKYGVILENLYAYNNLTPNDYIVAGTKIYLKPPPVLKQVAIATNQPEDIEAKNGNQPVSSLNTITYTVHPRESLYAISKKYGVTVDDIKKWNNLKSDNLQVGQQLIISK